MTVRVNEMGVIEREKLIDMAKALDEQEMRIIIDNLPLEMLADRVAREWNKV